MPAYLTAPAARERLSNRFGITANPLDGDLDAASDELDARGPFLGERYASNEQARAFPRSVTAPGDTVGVVPERVLDWVALRAYQLGQEDLPPVSGEAVLDDQVRYARPKKSRVERLMKSLLVPYRRGSVRIARAVS